MPNLTATYDSLQVFVSEITGCEQGVTDDDLNVVLAALRDVGAQIDSEVILPQSQHGVLQLLVPTVRYHVKLTGTLLALAQLAWSASQLYADPDKVGGYFLFASALQTLQSASRKLSIGEGELCLLLSLRHAGSDAARNLLSEFPQAAEIASALSTDRAGSICHSSCIFHRQDSVPISVTAVEDKLFALAIPPSNVVERRGEGWWVVS